MSAVTVMVCVVNIRNMWLQGFFWINWISCPETVCTVLKEQFMCGLLDQSHDSLEASSCGSWISVSCPFDHIDVFSEGHFTGQGEEDSFVLDLNLELPCGVVKNDFYPLTENSFIGSNSFVNTSNVHWNSIWHFSFSCMVLVSPTDGKDVGGMFVIGISIENSHHHCEIWLSRVASDATSKGKGCVLFGKIWFSCHLVVLSGTIGGSVVATQVQVCHRVSEKDVSDKVRLQCSTFHHIR